MASVIQMHIMHDIIMPVDNCNTSQVLSLGYIPGSVIVHFCEPLARYSSLGGGAVNAGQLGELAVIKV